MPAKHDFIFSPQGGGAAHHTYFLDPRAFKATNWEAARRDTQLGPESLVARP